MEDYRRFLAQKLLTEDQVVTYRLLGRSLKVHVNAAKEMLYDFHKWQNDKKPGTLHATYIVYGIKHKPSIEQQDDEDVEMTDSQPSDPDHAPFSDVVPATTLTLVAEEKLEEILTQYSTVTSIHVYSLAPHPQNDLQLLADTAKQVIDLTLADSTLASSPELGVIINPNVRRRQRPAGSAAPAKPKAEPKPAVKLEVKQEVKASASATTQETSKESAAAPASKKPTASSAAVKKSTPASSLKRQGSSGIGQMFAKAAANPKKPAAKPKTEEAESPALSDDGEDDAEPTPDVKTEEDNSKARQARKDRQAELRRMMEESDDEEEEAEKAESDADEPMEDEEPPPEPEAEPEAKAEEPAEVVSSASGGRRRGRRRVTKKKQIMDDKGYLVTVQEAGWESFSEDEATPTPPPASKPKSQPTAATKSEPAAKPKKSAGKGAQGNIMSFFSKK